MATIKEFFDTDIKALSYHIDWGMQRIDGLKMPSITAKIAQDLDANAKYLSFFIPADVDVIAYITLILTSPETNRCVLTPDGDPIYIEAGLSEYSEKMSSKTLLFTRRVFLYIDSLLDAGTRKDITEFGSQHGFHVVVRDKEYAEKISMMKKPLAFISHDSRDKDDLVRGLALELSKLMCPVWYDEYSLKVGDSLRESIENGLKETKKCILILSPNFIANGGWGKAEFDSIYTREILEKNNVILPVWHNVNVKDVYQYSPRLADKVGLNSSLGIEDLAKKLFHSINFSSP